MTTNPQTMVRVYLHYLYDDATKIIYYCENMPENRNDLIYIGQSDNPKPKAAAAFFMQQGKINEGFRLRNLDEE